MKFSGEEHTGLNHSPVIRKVKFRFYEELNDHLPKHWKKKAFDYEFKGNPAIKNSIQAIGVPHGEVDLILVNGKSVDFNYQMQGGEEISVFPKFESLDISPLIKLRPSPLRETRFVVDVNLGKLAQKLRLLGFDTLFRNDFEDDEIIEISLKEKRIILTRDKGILKQNAVTHGYFIRNDEPKKQLTEVIERFQLQNAFRPFSRCSNCNGELEKVSKTNLTAILPDDTLNYYHEFWKCTGCGKIYWEGSHFGKILNWIDRLQNG
ncbi:MAG: Mut7-C RNAse domain-containing protein [Mariniphaga sp.]